MQPPSRCSILHEPGQARNMGGNDSAIRFDGHNKDAWRHFRFIVPPQGEFGIDRRLMGGMQSLRRDDNVFVTAPQDETPAFTNERGSVAAAEFMAMFTLAVGDCLGQCLRRCRLGCRAPSTIGRKHERGHIQHPFVVALRQQWWAWGGSRLRGTRAHAGNVVSKRIDAPYRSAVVGRGSRFGTRKPPPIRGLRMIRSSSQPS